MGLVFFAFFILSIYLSDEVLLAIDGVAEKTKEIPLDKIRTTLIWILSIAGNCHYRCCSWHLFPVIRIAVTKTQKKLQGAKTIGSLDFFTVPVPA